MQKLLPHRTAAVWLSLALGWTGLHRWYVLGVAKGLRDVWFWAYAAASLIGLWGIRRAWQLGQDDKLSWALIPFFGFALAAACLTAIYYALCSPERWVSHIRQAQRVNRSGQGATDSGADAEIVGAEIADTETVGAETAAAENLATQPRHSRNALCVFAAVVALMVGSIALVASIVFSLQRYFEYQIEEAQKMSQGG